MHVVATFEHSLQLEIALTKLELKGIRKDHILVVPLAPKLGQKQLFDTIHRSDGMSLTNIPSILATVLSVLGTIYGFLLPWGPIIWGVIGIVIGWAVGLSVNYLWLKKRASRKKIKNTASELVLMISCSVEQNETVMKILYDHDAIGIGKVE